MQIAFIPYDIGCENDDFSQASHPCVKVCQSLVRALARSRVHTAGARVGRVLHESVCVCVRQSRLLERPVGRSLRPPQTREKYTRQSYALTSSFPISNAVQQHVRVAQGEECHFRERFKATIWRMRRRSQSAQRRRRKSVMKMRRRSGDPSSPSFIFRRRVLKRAVST